MTPFLVAVVVFLASLVMGFAVVWSLWESRKPLTMRADPQTDGSIRTVALYTPRQRLARVLVRVESLLVRPVNRGELMPRGYGLAWVAYNAPQAVFMPIPLNVIARALRASWLWFKRGGVAVPSDAAEAFEAGIRLERSRWHSLMEDPLG